MKIRIPDEWMKKWAKIEADFDPLDYSKYRTCPSCRGYNVERQWCDVCKGWGVVDACNAAAPKPDSRNPQAAHSVYTQDLKNLIYADQQLGYRGETDLKYEEILRLIDRGWMIEGDENNEFDISGEGRNLIDVALSAAPKPEAEG